VLFGDLNFRVFLDLQSAKRLIFHHDYEELIKHDEFTEYRKDHLLLKSFKEGALSFDPTYKYKPNGADYDQGLKERVPSWCDRVLFDAESNLTQVFYGRAELRLSDHRPVFALFEAKIRTINEEAKEEIELKLIEKFRSLQP